MSTNANKETHGCELFDAYLAAKKALNTRIKQVLDILAKFNALDVTPSEAARLVAQETTQVSSHQWRCNSGHETIYCEHSYGHRSYGVFQKCTVKVPVKYVPDYYKWINIIFWCIVGTGLIFVIFKLKSFFHIP